MKKLKHDSEAKVNNLTRKTLVNHYIVNQTFLMGLCKSPESLL